MKVSLEIEVPDDKYCFYRKVHCSPEHQYEHFGSSTTGGNLWCKIGFHKQIVKENGVLKPNDCLKLNVIKGEFR